jgi:hypothetical protein
MTVLNDRIDIITNLPIKKLMTNFWISWTGRSNLGTMNNLKGASIKYSIGKGITAVLGDTENLSDLFHIFKR